MSHKIIITHHARQRWLERVVDPKRYRHLSQCLGCEECTSLLHNIRSILKNMASDVNTAIVRRFLRAKNNPITNPMFLEAIKKQYPNDKLVYYKEGDAVFVTAVRPDSAIPVLLTVITDDMIDGTILMATRSKEELGQVFRRWNFEARQKSTFQSRFLE